MKVQLKYILPAAMGLLDVALMVWDIYNQRIIVSMGMGWDTGAPLWPYQTPDTLLLALNFPAYLIATPISRILDILVPRHYFVLFPAMLLWWWLVGLFFDNRRVNDGARMAPIKAILLCLLALGSFSFGVEESRWAFSWWWTYSRTLLSVSDLILLRLFAPSVWLVALGSVSLLAALKRRP